MKDKKAKNETIHPLCFRCEFRALYLEAQIRPRVECADIESSVYSCYMYRPVIPAKLKPDAKDKRPPVGNPSLTARSHCIGLATDENTFTLNVFPCKDNAFILAWTPKQRKSKRKNNKNSKGETI